MRLVVAFWDGIDAARPERTVERLNTISVKGLGHIPPGNYMRAREDQ